MANGVVGTMRQSKMDSFVEISINNFIGYVVAICSQIIIFPLYDIHVSFAEDLAIGLCFTLLALGRGYIIRRWFSKFLAQSRKDSAVEVIANLIIGYGIAVGSQLIIFPLFGITIPLTDNFFIGAWFVIIAFIRGYIVRRYFNGRLKNV